MSAQTVLLAKRVSVTRDFHPRELGPRGGVIRTERFTTAGRMVGPNGLEPLTSTVSRWRSSQLSYGPTDLPQS